MIQDLVKIALTDPEMVGLSGAAGTMIPYVGPLVPMAAGGYLAQDEDKLRAALASGGGWLGGALGGGVGGALGGGLLGAPIGMGLGQLGLLPDERSLLEKIKGDSRAPHDAALGGAVGAVGGSVLGTVAGGGVGAGAGYDWARERGQDKRREEKRQAKKQLPTKKESSMSNQNEPSEQDALLAYGHGALVKCAEEGITPEQLYEVARQTNDEQLAKIAQLTYEVRERLYAPKGE